MVVEGSCFQVICACVIEEDCGDDFLNNSYGLFKTLLHVGIKLK